MPAHCWHPSATAFSFKEIHPRGPPVLTQVLCSGKCKTAAVAMLTELWGPSPVLYSPQLPFIPASTRPCWEFNFLPILQMWSLRPRRAHGVARKQDPGEPRVGGKARCWPQSCPQQAGSSGGRLKRQTPCGNNRGLPQPRKEPKSRLCPLESPSPFLLGVHPFTLIGHLPKL